MIQERVESLDFGYSQQHLCNVNLLSYRGGIASVPCRGSCSYEAKPNIMYFRRAYAILHLHVGEPLLAWPDTYAVISEEN